MIILIYFLLSILFPWNVFAGFAAETLVKTSSGFTAIEHIQVGDTVYCCTHEHTNKVTHIQSTIEPNCMCIVTDANTDPLIISNTQRVYVPTEVTWKTAQHIQPGELLLTQDDTLIKVKEVYPLDKASKCFDISVANCHTFFVSHDAIRVHNAVPIFVALGWAFGAGVLEFIGVSATALVAGGAVGVTLYKDKQRQKNDFHVGEYKVSCNGGSSPQDPNEFKKRHPHGQYKDAPYHKAHKSGRKNPAPKDGQTALDNSIQIKGTSPRRIGISQDQFVVLDQTSSGTYHGHVRAWEELTEGTQNILEKNNLVTSKGKIIHR